MTRYVDRLTSWLGSYVTILAAVFIIAVWIIGGIVRGGFTDEYQIPINTLTTIVTFLMVFVIQNSANRSDRAMHAKLDALIHATEGADDNLERIEDQPEKSIEEVRR